jgi:peptidoglycan/LPS O-acetylase OafA/YrhL
MGFHYDLPFGRAGLFGVDIFFALSGFLITMILLEEWEQSGTIHLRNFYIRRMLRLFPALILLLLVFSPVAPKPYIFSTLFYFTNWVKAFHLQSESLYLDHTWSLSVEEQYYLFWPMILLFLLQRKVPKQLLVFIPLCLGAASALARFFVWNTTNDWFRVYMGTDLHADGLLIGSAFGIATIYGFIPDFSKHKMIYSLLTILTLSLGVWLLIDKQLTQTFIPTYGNLGVSLGTLLLISRLVHYPSPSLSKIFCFPPLVKIGIISYGLYLWHAPVAVVVDQIPVVGPSWIYSALSVLFTFLAASASFLLVEKPLLRQKNRLTTQILRSSTHSM